jgi:Zn ribbon nucleic-acid-binding protein
MRNCDDCGFKKWWKTKHYETIIRGEEKIKVRMWRCVKCGHVQSEVPPFIRQKPKVLYYDIETALMKVDIFNLFIPGKFISWKSIERKSFVVSWAAGWLGGNKIESAALTPAEAKRGSDKRILQALWELIDNADYVCGHNSNRFDNKFINYRFLKNNIPAPLGYRTVDTLAFAKKYFKNDSNALEHWSLDLGGDPKDEMELDDWKAVARGDIKAIKKMEFYNRGDVRNGIIVLQKFRDWVEPSGVNLFK